MGVGFLGSPGGLSDDYEVAVERLQYRAQLIGTWDGTVTTPWTPPYESLWIPRLRPLRRRQPRQGRTGCPLLWNR